MTTLVLVQHGEKERIPGDPGLTPHGHIQAQRAAGALAELGRPIAVYSSRMKRAAETAGEIAGRFGLAVRYDDRFTERINWEGEPVQSFASFLVDWERSTSDRDYVPASGDSSHQAAARMLAAICDVADRHPAALAAVITHGGVTVDLLRTLLGDAVLAASAPSLLTDGVPPCALTTLRRVHTAWVVDNVAAAVHRLDGGLP